MTFLEHIGNMCSEYDLKFLFSFYFMCSGWYIEKILLALMCSSITPVTLVSQETPVSRDNLFWSVTILTFVILGLKVTGFFFCAIFLGSILLNVHYLSSISGYGEKELAHPDTVSKGKLIKIVLSKFR